MIRSMFIRFNLCGVVLLLAPLVSAEPLQPTASNCDSLNSVPLRQHFDYATDIQPIFSARCANCHVDANGNFEADLVLDPGESWSNLVNHPSSQLGGENFLRVRPSQPWGSLLFWKLNCGTPGLGQRMPFARPPIPIEDQAMIHDWILAGAPEFLDDTVFRSQFETRG